MLRRVIGEQIELDIIPTIGLWPVEVDPTQLEQVIINLAGVKFLEKPFSSVSLTHKVREVLEGRTP